MRGEMNQYLPGIYQAIGDHSLLAHLVAAFETILLHDAQRGLEHRALEEVVADLARYFDPRQTEAEFLPWLAGWVALGLRADLSEPRKREAIARIVPLYARRGTPHGMKELVELFTGGTITFEEPQDLELQIREHSTIGRDMWLGGPPPHFFQAHFAPPESGSADREESARRHRLKIEIARWAIDIAKPAHTWYSLDVAAPG
jgi:phage tail-like protein